MELIGLLFPLVADHQTQVPDIGEPGTEAILIEIAFSYFRFRYQRVQYFGKLALWFW
jgi:hypothetical protein